MRYVFVFALSAMILILTAMVLVGIWVYRDAKSRGLPAGVWTLVAILVPNFIGLLLYFLLGRREELYPCPKCGAGVPVKQSFCGRCGTQVTAADREGLRPHRGGCGFLVGIITCIVISILFCLFAVVAVFRMDPTDGSFDWTPSISTIYFENDWGAKWHVSFHYTNKTPSTSFTIGQDGPSILYYEGHCKEGPLSLRIYQGDVEQVIDLSGEGKSGTVDLAIFQPGTVHLELDNQKGKGTNVSFTSNWE